MNAYALTGGTAQRPATTRHSTLNMGRLWLLSLLFASVTLKASEIAAEYIDPLTCGEGVAKRIDLPENNKSLRLKWVQKLGSTAILEVREAGQDVVINGVEEIITIPVPPRLGVSMVVMNRPLSLDITRLRPSAAAGALELHLHCRPDRTMAIRRWFDAVTFLLPSLGGGAGSLRDTSLASTLKSIAAAVHDDRSRALTQHLHAQMLYLTGRSDDAVDAFISAAKQWQAIGDQPRAAAAWVGVAEDLTRSGRYDDTLDVTRGPGMPDSTHYYGVRLENARCNALHYLARREEASACFAWTSAHLDELEEVLELASTSINFAATERMLGRTESSRKLLHASIDLARGPQSWVIEGRARLALAIIARDEVNMGEALSQLNQAEALFALASEPRWQSIALATLAPWLADLGAIGDARAANQKALALLDADHAPARVAAADLIAARIELVAHRPLAALGHAERAQHRYTALGMAHETALATLQRAEALLYLDRSDDAEHLLSEIGDIGQHADTLQQRYRLISAELALARADTTTAERHLATLNERMTWHRRIDRNRLTALLHQMQGNSEAALDHLSSGHHTLRLPALATDNALLAHALGQSWMPLAQLATDLIAYEWQDGQLTTQQVVDKLLPWLIDSTPQAVNTHSNRGRGSGTALDRSLSRLLTANQDTESDTTGDFDQLRSLLERLGHSDSMTAMPQTVSRLNVVLNRPWMALARGRRHLLRLWMTPGQSPDVHMIDPAMLAASLDALREALAHPGTDISVLDRHARTLSTLLLADLPRTSAPERLTVLADPISRTIPWPMLIWPGSDQALVETTAITLMTPVERLGPQATTSPSLQVLIAAQNRVDPAGTQPTSPSLPTLTGALREPALIAEAMAPRPILTRTLEDRSDTLDALAQPGAWLHLSAHGQTRSDRLLASGIWLEPSKPGQPPDFFGWADALERGVGAELIVLNACQLAESSPAAAAALDFASAISRAGARHTIAAQWPVSDTASAVWVPAFYRTLTRNDTLDPALALSEARRALRASRAFRHPYHWAGWVHLERVAVGAPAP